MPKNEVGMADRVIKRKLLAIVQFGPATPTSGFKAGEYYQVTIDPNMASPAGDYIRFGLYEGDEINGWQRVEAMTVAEILGPSEVKFAQKDSSGQPVTPSGYSEDPKAEVAMRHIKE